MNTRARFAAVTMLVGALCVPAALAQTPEYSTITFTEPTLVGETVLPPGNYLIQVLPGFTSRNRVQITDLNRETIHATLLTVPHQAGPNAEIPNTRLIFYPAVEGQPRALRTWFAPDPVGNEGHDIVYDEDRAKMLARAARAPVVSYRAPVVVAEVKEDLPTLRIVTPEARIEPYVAPAPRVTTTVRTPAPVVREVRTELPRTGSNVPLFALLGLLAVSGAIVFRAVNR